MTEIRVATKDSPAIYRFEARRTGGNVVFGQDIEKDEYSILAKKVQENPQDYGF